MSPCLSSLWHTYQSRGQCGAPWCASGWQSAPGLVPRCSRVVAVEQHTHLGLCKTKRGWSLRHPAARSLQVWVCQAPLEQGELFLCKLQALRWCMVVVRKPVWKQFWILVTPPRLPLEIPFLKNKKKWDGCCLVGQLYGKPASKHQPRREGKSLRYGAALTPKLLSVQPWFYVTENLVQNNRSFLGFKAFVAVVQSWHYTSHSAT